MHYSSRSAFTLLELLVVVSIISLLVQLLIPAVISAREAARHFRCRNNLRQIALAALAHEEARGYLPSGGWGYRWLGDADRGFGEGQPGGWAYTPLPFMEENRLFELGAGQSAEEKQRAAAVLCSTPRAGMNCPTRRDSGPHALSPRFRPLDAHNLDDLPGGMVRSDYAMNAGTMIPNLKELNQSMPTTFQRADDPNFKWPYLGEANGVSYLLSEVRVAQVSDGLSKTYLVGEKGLSLDNYFNGESHGDDGSMYQGYDWDTHRWAGGKQARPRRDGERKETFRGFGSAHAGGFNMAFCDGSVHHITYSIDPSTHEYFANRMDGESVNWEIE